MLDPPGAEVKSGCEATPHRYWEPNLSLYLWPLQEQLLTTSSSPPALLSTFCSPTPVWPASRYTENFQGTANIQMCVEWSQEVGDKTEAQMGGDIVRTPNFSS